MKYEDLSVFDLSLIKENAAKLIIHSNIQDRNEALLKSMLSCIHSKGFNLENKPEGIINQFIRENSDNSGYSYARSNPSADDVIKNILTFMTKVGIIIVKDETRTTTWSKPNPGWYTTDVHYKKPWVF